MTCVVTARNNDTARIEASGATATIKLVNDNAQILFIQIPKEQRREGKGRELIQAAESQAASMGAGKILCDYTDQAEGMGQFLKACGYESSDRGHIISIDTRELLASQGVIKSMRIKFRKINTMVLDDMYMLQWAEMGDFLNRHGFEIRDEDFDRYDPELSCAAFNPEGNIRAVLLSTLKDESIYIELLFGFSNKKPEYVLCVCQEFTRAMTEMMKERAINRIYIYSCSDYVEQLLKRLLDKKESMKTEIHVMHAEKELEPVSAITDEKPESEGDIWLWQSEAEEFMGQRNINEKALWMAGRR